jgi:hypothetical protein
MTHIKGRTAKSALNNARKKYKMGIKSVNRVDNIKPDSHGMKTYRIVKN